jgi:tRNA A37 threonylcarbamoyladenosine modification protein TsaB
MNIVVEVKDRKITIALRDGESLLDEVVLGDERNLGVKLLPEIDKMLQKRQLEMKKVDKIEVLSDQGDAFTTTRIAKTVAETWNWAVNQD